MGILDKWPPVIRPIEDPGDLRDLCLSVGWEFSEEQVRFYLSAGSFFGHVADGVLASSAGVFRYGPGCGSLAFIGLVIVRPEFSRRGLGRAVLGQALDQCDAFGLPAALVSTEAGLPLYLSSGFAPAGNVRRLERPADGRGSGMPVRDDGRREDWSDAEEEILVLDHRAFGADRGFFLRELARRASRRAVFRDRRGSVLGFGLAVPNGENLRVGPVIAAEARVAANLVRVLAESWPGAVRLDVPEDQEAFLQEARSMGFEAVRESPVLVRGAGSLPGEARQRFAIADPTSG